MASSTWGFVAPWLAVLEDRLSYHYPKREGESWAADKPVVEVDLRSIQNDLKTLLQLREALALLAAVARVERDAWRTLLHEFCNVKMADGVELFEEFPSRFLLRCSFDGLTQEEEDSLVDGLVLLCGVSQRLHPSGEYLAALSAIERHASKADERPPKDVTVSVQVYFHEWRKEALQSIGCVRRAEKLVQQEWQQYNTSLDKQEVATALRSTLVMEPMTADCHDMSSDICRPECVDTLERLMLDNMRFSEVVFLIRWGAEKTSFSRLMFSIFEGNRSHLDDALDSEESKPLQVGAVHLVLVKIATASVMETVGSALVSNQATRKLSLRLRIDLDDPESSREWWKWLAYGIFSKRARRHSRLESLALVSTSCMRLEDMEAFSSILDAERPEEELFGTPRGVVEEQDAVLSPSALIRWQVTLQGQPDRMPNDLKFDCPVCVRTFSDDGVSDWVNVVVPGYGWCQVQRSDLTANERTDGADDCSPRLTSLTVGFDNFDQHISEGFPRFLAAVGPSLKFLTVDEAGLEVDERFVDFVLQCCPNLHELAITGEWTNLRFNFSDYRVKRIPLPSLRYDWDDLVALSTELCNPHSPLTKCLRRLRVRVGDFFSDEDDEAARHGELQSLLRMLSANRDLEYFDVGVHSSFLGYIDEFRQHHLTPTNRSLKLPIESKIAFLSVQQPTAKTSGELLSGLDHHVVSRVFSFAARPVLRQVYFRHEYDGKNYNFTI